MFRAAVIILVFLLWPSSVQAEQSNIICESRSTALKNIQGTYGEALVAYGLDVGGNLIELYRNPKTQSWTILVSFTKGISCLVGAGTKLEMLETDGERCARAVNGT
jgi:hypothetical protein